METVEVERVLFIIDNANLERFLAIIDENKPFMRKDGNSYYRLSIGIESIDDNVVKNCITVSDRFKDVWDKRDEINKKIREFPWKSIGIEVSEKILDYPEILLYRFIHY